MASNIVEAEPLIGSLHPQSEQSSFSEAQVQLTSSFKRHRADARRILSSRTKDYFILGLVTVDVALLLLNILIKLTACEMHQRKEPWVQAVSQTLQSIGVGFSLVFVLELVTCLVAFGPKYLASWFHVFDSFIIGLALIIGTMTGGVVTDVGSLVIALRLWRLAQLSDEIVLDAQERIHGLEQRNQELSDEIVAVRHRLDLYHV